MPNQADIRDYLDRSGDPSFLWDKPTEEFDGGWFSYSLDDEYGALVVWQAYGKAPALLKRAKALAASHGKPLIRFATRHNGAAMARLFGGYIVGTIVDIEVGNG